MRLLWLFVMLLSMTGFGPAQELSITRDGGDYSLSWMSSFPPNSGVEATMEFDLQSSADLKNWGVVQSTSVAEGEGAGQMDATVPAAGSRFFRLDTRLRYAHRESQSAQPARYNQQYANALTALGEYSFARFQSESESRRGLDQIDWDPTTATHWTEFNTPRSDPPTDPEDPRLWDFSLTPAEVAKFTQNGFVVSRIRQYPTPVEAYYRIWTDDLPVFITADSVLDAWHRSFSYILEELEELYLYPRLRNLAAHTTSSLRVPTSPPQFIPPSMISNTGLADHVRNDFWEESLLLSPVDEAKVQQAIEDVELYLNVGAGLLVGSNLTPTRVSSTTASDWYAAAVTASKSQRFGLYGDLERIMDMTQFQVRGHYANSVTLEAYFRGLMWFSTAGFRMGGGNPVAGSDRELRAAAVLSLAIRDAGYLPAWEEIEAVLESFFGQPDGMTAREMISFLETNGADTLADLGDDTTLADLRAALLSSTYGFREIPSGNAASTCNPSDFEEARYFSLFGQRWTPDSWGLSKGVFPHVREGDLALYRRMPSNVDIAYSVLGNCAAMPALVERMESTTGVPFRDGFRFHRNLAAVREVMDGQAEEFWTESIYGRWMHTLRALSTPPDDNGPDTFRTHAWGLRIMNAQLGSWTQLRHDTVLYAAQSYTPPVLCDFPDGYVEPNPEFWRRMAAMATQLESAISVLPMTDWIGTAVRDAFGNPLTIDAWLPVANPPATAVGFDPALFGPSEVSPIDSSERKAAIITHLSAFAQTCTTLREIADQQAAGLAFTPAMATFIRGTVEDAGAVYIQQRTYNGWFPQLYYSSSLEGITETDTSAVEAPVVVDVHTDTADPICSGDSGGVLHEGIGRMNLMMVAAKHSGGTGCVYAGPVFSQHEFVESIGTRLTDEQWETRVKNYSLPEPAAWQLEFIGEFIAD